MIRRQFQKFIYILSLISYISLQLHVLHMQHGNVSLISRSIKYSEKRDNSCLDDGNLNRSNTSVDLIFRHILSKFYQYFQTLPDRVFIYVYSMVCEQKQCIMKGAIYVINMHINAHIYHKYTYPYSLLVLKKCVRIKKQNKTLFKTENYLRLLLKLFSSS